MVFAVHSVQDLSVVPKAMSNMTGVLRRPTNTAVSQKEHLPTYPKIPGTTLTFSLFP